MLTHREQYPQQYTHASIGKHGTRKGHPEIHGTILRVLPSRWGQLAELKGCKGTDGGMVFYALTDLEIV